MKLKLILICCSICLLISNVTSFGLIGMAIGAIEGFTKGALKGSFGVLKPIAQKGIKSLKKTNDNDNNNGKNNDQLPHVNSNEDQHKKSHGNSNENIPGKPKKVKSVLQQILSDWATAIKEMYKNGGGNVESIIFGIILMLNKNIFTIIRNSSKKTRHEVNHMIINTSHTFGHMMQQKLENGFNEEKIKNEILAMRKIMENKQASSNDMIQAIHAQAPLISSAASQAYVVAYQRLQEHMKSLDPETKTSLQKIRLLIRKAQNDLHNVIFTNTNKISNDSKNVGTVYSTATNLFSNLFGAFRMFFPI